ncbi:hypothetical protein HK414_14390 [Ramlibacter terrae]|uniref:LapA family protein n=1 Tax=Ramlibacter terrae TaxID=2732511 RepID=A0ABX6P4P8_9BURK|nr:hypothetical protein HK414_14390 [Ramlibacter terrae]
MRSRAILLVVAILLVAAFAALNWSEFVRPTPLLFGLFVADAPLGAILLGLLALATIAFVLSAGTIRTQSLMESREHHKTLEAQRALADKAEASRFTDLRQHWTRSCVSCATATTSPAPSTTSRCWKASASCARSSNRSTAPWPRASPRWSTAGNPLRARPGLRPRVGDARHHERRPRAGDRRAPRGGAGRAAA